MSIDILQKKIRKSKNPSMIGLDPCMDCMPPHLLEQAYAEYGQNLRGLSEAYFLFCKEILDVLINLVPAIKVQSSYFEALGAEGVEAMQRVLAYASKKGYYVVLDGMRSDVGHIAQTYAQAVFEKIEIGETAFSPYVCDGLTLNGYLGSDSVKPYIKYCKEQGKNLFLAVKTSNKSSREVQELITGDRMIYTAMADLAMRWSTDLFGKNGYSEVAAIVGATNPQILKSLREKYDRLFFMVPGYGAQGGTAKNVQYAFDKFGHGAVICAARSVIFAWKKMDTDGKDFAEQALAAAEKMKADIEKYVLVI